MENLVALAPEHHQATRINKAKAEAHGADINLLPVVVEEFTHVALEQPIVLSKNGDTGEFVCVAMLGFDAKENLFWHNNQWQGIYLPLQLQRQPFFVGQENSNNDQEHLICINHHSPAVIRDQQDTSYESSEPLYHQDGQESEYLQQVKSTLTHLLRGEQQNKLLLTHLSQMELIQPLSLDITFANQESRRLTGLYTINQEKLGALTADNIALLHAQGLLPAIYAMTMSLGQIYPLIERKNTRLTG